MLPNRTPLTLSVTSQHGLRSPIFRENFSQELGFRERLAGSNPAAIDLVERMLKFDPRERCTIQEALCHPYLREMHDDCEEPIAERLFDLEFEQGYKAEMPKPLLQDLIFEEMLHFHPEEAHITPPRRSRKK